MADFNLPAFEDALQEVPPVSIRFHPAKSFHPDWAGAWQQQKVRWHPHGHYLHERPSFTLDPAWHAGGYYVQEAASMFLYEAVRQAVDIKKRLRVLDMCAAPGGKSTLLAAMLSEDSLLVCNEVIRSRMAALRENMERWGCPNGAVSGEASEVWERMEHFFDVIVTDVPCSGEGMFRKLPTAVSEWSPSHVSFCAARQKKIVAPVVRALAPGGVLIYSTCTYNPQENEENVAWMTRSFDLETVELDIPSEWNIAGNGSTGYHFYPHRTRGEGFFIAVLRRKEDGRRAVHSVPTGFKHLRRLTAGQLPVVTPWLQRPEEFSFFQTVSGEVLALPAACTEDYLALDKVLAAKWFGLMVGQLKGNNFVPAHALALSLAVADVLPRMPLDRREALQFLRKEPLQKPDSLAQGWALATYKNLSLGWVKVLSDRINNYLPSDRRILMQST